MATSETFRVGDRVTCNGRPLLGLGVVTAEENYGETLHVRWGNDQHSSGYAPSQLTRVAPPVVTADAANYATVTVSREAIGDWEREVNGRGWVRQDVVTGAHSWVIHKGANYEARNGRGWCHWFACPDDAREAADKALVAAGKLEASRAFVRLGEWEDMGETFATGRWLRRQPSGLMPLTQHASCDKGREEGDAGLVANGWLDPSRAFKAGPTLAPSMSVGPTGATGAVWPQTATRMQPEKHNSEPAHEWAREYLCKPLDAADLAVVSANALRKYSHHTINQPAKPAWGEWQLRTIHFGKEPHKAYLRESSVADSDLLFAKESEWGHGPATHPATDIDDARERADAFLVARGELEAGRAFKRVGDWAASSERHYFSASRARNHRDYARIRGNGWEAWDHAQTVAHGNETGDAGKAAADAELVRRGLLAESRAFKVARPKPIAFDAGGGVTAIDGLAFPAQGIAKVSDDEINAMYGKHSEVAMAMIGAKRFEESRSPACFVTIPRPVTDQTTVTLANWERCLPHLLSGASREFRDGFNRKHGPAWEAYQRGLAWVKEEMQCGRHTPRVVRVTVSVAAAKAYEYLGPEWVKANVR